MEEKTKCSKNTNRKIINSSRNFDLNNSFTFSSCNSSITLLLDLSPYMLGFDYESKSTPLSNLEMVVKDLLVKIREKK